MTQVRTKAIYISNKYNIQTVPIHFECDKFLLTLEKDFQLILNEVLSHTFQQQQQQLPN